MKRPSLLLVILTVVLVGLWLLIPQRPPRQPSAPQPVAAAPTQLPPESSETPPTIPSPPPVPEPEPIARTPQADLEQVSIVMESFRKSLGGNPVGANEDITKSLLGDNDKKLQIGLPPGIKQNAQGEMIDRWGTPFFFHQQSDTEMEIRSAGPDRKLYTEDDLTLK